MAVRAQNGAVETFGTFAAETTVTHGRIRVGTVTLTVRPLATQRTIAANGEAEFAIGAIDLLFPSGAQAEDDGLSAFIALALDGTNALNVDLMTDDSTVVSDSGYSQQAVTDWDLSTETDP